MKLSWAQKKRLKTRAAKKAAQNKRAAAKHERLNEYSYIVKTLNSEKESLEQKIVNLTAEIQNLSSNIEFTLEESISLTNKKGEVVEGKI